MKLKKDELIHVHLNKGIFLSFPVSYRCQLKKNISRSASQ